MRSGDVDFIVRAGDVGRLTFTLGAVAFDETQFTQQLVDAHSPYPLVWIVYARAQVQGAAVGDGFNVWLELTSGAGSARSTFTGLFTFPPPLDPANQEALFNTFPGTFTIFPFMAPAEALYARIRAQVVAPAPVAHVVRISAEVLVAPYHRGMVDIPQRVDRGIRDWNGVLDEDAEAFEFERRKGAR